jgi:MOSC domain-containing protein
MHVKELWRYPIKSLRGEQLNEIDISIHGFRGDRRVAVVSPEGHIITSRTKPRLLGLQGGVGPVNEPTVNGLAWFTEKAAALIREATATDAILVPMSEDEGFDVLPLLVATDGAVNYLDIDSRRLRPNILIGDVPGLTERDWLGGTLHIGPVRIRIAKLRERCVMTTYHPDTQQQDLNVLRRIVQKLDGTMALDCAVEEPGHVQVGDPVEFHPAQD